MRAQYGLQLTTAAMLMKDQEVFFKVTGGCSLPQLWVGEPLASGPWTLSPGGNRSKDFMIRTRANANYVVLSIVIDPRW